MKQSTSRGISFLRVTLYMTQQQVSRGIPTLIVPPLLYRELRILPNYPAFR